MSRFVSSLSLAAFYVAAILFVSPVQAGVIGYWDFEGNVNDLSGNNNHGTAGSSMQYVNNTPSAISGTQSLRSFTGGGATQVVTVPTSSSLESINDSISISFWMNSNLADNPSWSRLFQHGTEGNPSQSWMVNRNSGNNRVNVRVDTSGQHNQNIADTNAPDPVPYDNNWHHMIFSVDSGQWKKYVDGAMIGQGTYNHGTGLSNNQPFYMFGRNDGGPDGEYVGMLDDVALFDQPIQGYQAEYLFAGGNPLELPTSAPKVGVGPEGGKGYWGIREVYDSNSIDSVGAAITSLQSGNGTIYDSTSHNVINFGNNGQDGTGNPFLGGGGNNFSQIAHGYVEIEDAGDYTFYARGDDGFQLRIIGETWDSVTDLNDGTAVIFEDTMANDNLGGNVNGYGVINLDEGIYELEYLFFEYGGGEYNELWAAQGVFTSFDSSAFRLVGDVDNGGLALVNAPVIPEPATWAVFALGLVGLGYHARRRRN